MRHELFEVGSYDYSDLDDRLTKPVEWTEDDLKLIAENYRGGIPLTSEHDNIYVGIGNNIEYEKGKLFLEIPDELNMEGKGISPKVDVLLKDNGDSFGIDTMSLIDVGVTKHPRKIRLLNSDIAGETGQTGNPNPEPSAPQPQPQPPAKDTNVATSLLLEKLQGKDAEIGKLQDEINNLKEESKKYDEIKKAIKKYKESRHLRKKSKKVKEIYQRIKENISEYDDVEIVVLKHYFAVKVNKKNICEIALLKNYLTIWIDLEFDKINDSLNRVKDVSDVGHWGTGNCKIQINEIDEVHYFMELFKQSYDEKI